MTWGNFKPDSVSEAYKKMKAEELKGNQHKLDKNKNGKLDAEDFKKLRKEDAVEEGVNKSDIPAYKRKDDKVTLADLEKERTQNKSHSVQLAKNNGTMKKEDAEVGAEELVEYEAKDGVYKHQAKAGRYGGSEKESDYVKGPSAAQLKKIEDEKKAKVKKEGLDLFSEREIDTLISEVLKASDDAGKWISDFVSSDNPKFAGKSKADRKKQALAAYYAAQKKESVDYDSFLEEAVDLVKTSAKEIKHANVKDKDDDKDTMEPRAQGEKDFLDKLSVNVTDEPAAAAGNDQTGSGRVSSASKPTAQGAGKYDGKNKTGVKEDTSEDSIDEAKGKSCTCKEDCSCKKSYSTFKEKMSKAC